MGPIVAWQSISSEGDFHHKIGGNEVLYSVPREAWISYICNSWLFRLLNLLDRGEQKQLPIGLSEWNRWLICRLRDALLLRKQKLIKC